MTANEELKKFTRLIWPRNSIDGFQRRWVIVAKLAGIEPEYMKRVDYVCFVILASAEFQKETNTPFPYSQEDQIKFDSWLKAFIITTD